MWAAREGHPGVAQLLLDGGANTEEKDTKVRPPRSHERYVGDRVHFIIGYMRCDVGLG